MAENNSVVDYTVVKQLQAQVAGELTRRRAKRESDGLAPLSDADERQLALSVINAQVAEYMRQQTRAGYAPPDASVDLQLAAAVDAAIYGAGELQELLDDDEIENININGADQVWITYADGRGTVLGRPVAASDEELIEIVQNLAAYSSMTARPWTPTHPVLNLRLPGGARLAAVMSATARPAVSIRRNRYPQMTIDDLVGLGTISTEIAAFFRACITARMNIVVGGATDAGKTTLLRALINEIPPAERLITVEKALELGVEHDTVRHPDVVALEEVLSDAEGRGGVSMDQLVAVTRRLDPDRVIVGEVMGPEVIAMLTAMSQGNNGSLSTVHARTATGVIRKLATYAVQHDQLAFPVTFALIAESIDFIVFIEKNRLDEGRRAVTQVVEVGGFAGGAVSTSQVFSPDAVTGKAVRVRDVALARAVELADAGWVETRL